jgi:hypothetical protein
MIFLGLYTGQRLADVATLRWSNIDLNKCEIRFTKSSMRSASGPYSWHCFPLIGSCPTFATTLLHETVFLRPLTGSSVTFAR